MTTLHSLPVSTSRRSDNSLLPLGRFGAALGYIVLLSLALVACGDDDDSANAGASGAGAGGQGGSAGSSGQSGSSNGGQSGSGGSSYQYVSKGEGAISDEEFGGDRSVNLYVPSGYDNENPLPLVILLHGYGANGVAQELLFKLTPLADELGFFYAHPDGTRDSTGKLFWNATNACCDSDGTAVDDSAYLMGLVDEFSAKYKIDPKRVYFTGHSNGGFMSFRMACDHADRVAAIASLAGTTFLDDADCAHTEPVSVLHSHGTADDVVAYDGGIINGSSFPGAIETVEKWVKFNGCSETPETSATKLDSDSSLDGAETTVKTWSDNCSAGSEVVLWTIDGAAHIPALTADYSRSLVEFLLSKKKQ